MLNMRSFSMPSLSADSSPSNPPEDLHSKLQAGIPHSSETETMTAVVRAFSATKALHQVLGLRDPEPFVPPPAMPSEFTTRFGIGLYECGQLNNEIEFAQRRTEGLTTSPPSQQGRTNLADILEEKESPVRAASMNFPTGDTGEKLRIGVPKWISNKQAVPVAQRYTFLDSDNDAANDAAGERADYEPDGKDDSLWKYESGTTLTASNYSRQGSAAGNTVVATSFLPRISSLLLPERYHVNNNAGSNPHHPTSKRPPGLHPTSAQFSVPKNRQHADKNLCNYAQSKLSSLRRIGSLPLLFPSPGIYQRFQDFKEPVESHVDSSVGSRNAFHDANLNPNEETVSSPAPEITIQAPSPVRAKTTRKRAPSSLNPNEFGLPVSRRVCRDDVTGLPVILYKEAAWKADLAGNTHALLTILLTWSHAMWSFYNRLPDPKLFSIHPAFPYPVTPPLNKQLLSVSFYDTSIEPHKELRFLGPGDVAEVSYHEVDVFSDTASNSSLNSFHCSSSVDAISRKLGLAASEVPKHVRYMSMPQRAKTGEGRWCYVLIKGNHPEDGGTSPHVILAWHTSAITGRSDCLHTIYPSDATSDPVAPSQSKLKRFSSLQNFGLALRSSTKLSFHQTLRSVSSSTEFPAVDTSANIGKQGGATLHRTVLKMDKAGSVPLIEGYRVDILAFKDWMEACGHGNGKVIMWRERDLTASRSDRQKSEPGGTDTNNR